MKIILAGGSGMIGSRLSAALRARGDEVVLLTRSAGAQISDGIKRVIWDGRMPGEWCSELNGADALVNLSGENLGRGRWTADRKTALLSSRVDSTRALVQAVYEVRQPPRVYLQASAIGYYGSSSRTNLDENSPPGAGFLAEICQKWEAETAAVVNRGMRLVILRTGLVLDRKEGALGRMLLPYRFFLGGPLGRGKQWYSWIHPADQVQAMLFLLAGDSHQGAFNLTAPHPVTQDEFGRLLAAVIRRPHWLPVPAAGLKLLLGEMSSLVLEGQHVIPARLLEAGYQFSFPYLSEALRDLLQAG